MCQSLICEPTRRSATSDWLSTDIADDDWTACQAVGHAAYFLDMGGVVAPSATGYGIVIAVFEARVTPGQIVLSGTVVLDEATYFTALNE